MPYYDPSLGREVPTLPEQWRSLGCSQIVGATLLLAMLSGLAYWGWTYLSEHTAAARLSRLSRSVEVEAAGHLTQEGELWVDATVTNRDTTARRITVGVRLPVDYRDCSDSRDSGTITYSSTHSETDSYASAEALLGPGESTTVRIPLEPSPHYGARFYVTHCRAVVGEPIVKILDIE